MRHGRFLKKNLTTRSIGIKCWQKMENGTRDAISADDPKGDGKSLPAEGGAHFCATVFVYDPDRGKFLFVHHRGQGKWLPPGGHLEPNERPDRAALREVREETGLAVDLVGAPLPAFIPGLEDIPMASPHGLQAYRMAPGHEHWDLIYLAIARGGTPVANERESLAIAYFSPMEIEDPAFNTYPNIRSWIHFFWEKVKNLGETSSHNPCKKKGKPPDE
jgi:8-oxo-dGTP pyrophosphatase MutT (NUDIX family)